MAYFNSKIDQFHLTFEHMLPSPKKFKPFYAKKSMLSSLLLLMILFNLSLVNAQKNTKGVKDIVLRACTEEIGNGLYQVSFGYENPNRKEINVGEENSFVTSNKETKKSKGISQFKKGFVSKAFVKQFSENEVVEWKVVNPNGKIHTVIASANSSHCPPEDTGVIFPVFDQGIGKSTDLIGAKLGSLAQGSAGDQPSDIIYQINGEQKVLIEIVPNEGKTQELILKLQNYYGLVLSDFLIAPQIILSQSLSTVDVYFPINRLVELNTETELINFARPLYPSLINSGVTRSQGDSILNTFKVRDAFRMVEEGKIVTVDGRRIRVGVISDSYNKQPYTVKSKAQVDIENGDLPGALNPFGFDQEVQVLAENPKDGASDEGRAMLQILHDMVPGADLSFYSGVASPRKFELGVIELALNDCSIIVDDVTFITEPFFGTSNTIEAIESFTDEEGKAYFTSAGNFGNEAYQSVFKNAISFPQTNFIPSGSPTTAHVFGMNSDGTEDVKQKISVEPGVYIIVLQWDESLASQDNYLGAQTDLDIYIVDDAGNLIVGNNRVNDFGDPTEIMVFQATGTGFANILITSANGPPPPGLAIRYVAFRSQGLTLDEYAGASTITGHAMTQSANTVGAMNYFNADAPQPTYYSSYGGQLPNGQLLEVDFLGPDGVNTNVLSIGEDIPQDTDDFPNFFGTSCAAPHAAGALALLMSALPSWYPDGLPAAMNLDGATHTAQAMNLFKRHAKPSGPPERSGSGLLDAEAVFKSIATMTPKLTKLIVEDGKTPSAEPFVVTILGAYLPDDPVVLFDGEELEIVSIGDGEIQAKVPEFTGNPGLSVDAGKITPVIEDNAVSNELKFFDDGKLALNIVADNINIEFGQDLSFSFVVEGLPEGQSFESLGLPSVVFSSPAVFPYPDVNNYSIFPSFETPLTQEQEDLFHVNFKKGLLQVSKKDLTIKPKEAEFVYGSPIIIELEYIYDTEGINDQEGFLNLIRDSHASDFYYENTFIFVNKFRAIVNEYEILNLIQQGSWMTSERIIQNKFRAIVNGMNFIDLDMQHFEDYFDGITDPETNKFRAIVNKFRAIVNGQDLINNQIELVFENKFRAIVNETGLGNETDLNDYSSIFAVVDLEDSSSETEESSIEKLYAMDLLTGNEVTETEGDRHYIFPGAFLSAMASNFNTSYDFNRLSILSTELSVSTGDLQIQQGMPIDSTLIQTTISGFVYEESAATIYPNGNVYQFVDDNGVEYQNGDVGVFNIHVRDPKNYNIVYDHIGKLYVNPYGDHLRKIRTYLDCIEVNENASDGLIYTANFRYENPNDVTIYVLHGDDNYLTSQGSFDGELPYTYLPGEGSFKINFDGQKLIWHLTTFESTHKTSVSSEATSESGKCSAKDIGNYVVYPNPVDDILYVQRNVLESGSIQIYNAYGLPQDLYEFKRNEGEVINLDMSTFSVGLYIIRIVSAKNTYTFNVLKQ